MYFIVANGVKVGGKSYSTNMPATDIERSAQVVAKEFKVKGFSDKKYDTIPLNIRITITMGFK